MKLEKPDKKRVKFEESDSDSELEPKEKTIKIKELPQETGVQEEPEPTEKPMTTLKTIREKDDDLTKLRLGKELIVHRMPKREPIFIRASHYYMNNRMMFIKQLTKILEPYFDEQKDKKAITCETIRNSSSDFTLMMHQKVVRDYLNLYAPYRGLLLYYSLGSGKTCTSVAIAEGMKSDKKIVLMTPASLKMNFFSELKKCGDALYRQKQHWEFISIEGQADYVRVLSRALNLKPEYVKRKKGAWMVNIKKPANFAQLSESDQTSVDEQLNEMIRAKYLDINYNGITNKKLAELTDDYTRNPFDHSVVIVDEAHNFVSRIVNKLRDKTALSYKLYHMLMDAVDVRIVLLSGTPIINYPNEIGVLFNILRGYIKTWKFELRTTAESRLKKMTKESLTEMFHAEGLDLVDYLEYSGKSNGLMTITRNPYGFVNTYVSDKKTAPKAPLKDVPKDVQKEVPQKDVQKEEPKEPEPEAPKEPEPKKKAATRTKKVAVAVKKGGNKTRKNHPTTKLYTVVDGMLKINHPEMDVLDYDETADHYNDTKEQDGIYGGDSAGVPTLGAAYGGSIHGGGLAEDYRGVMLDENGNVSDADFETAVLQVLKKNGIKCEKPTIEHFKCLPDDSKQFMEMFVSPTTGEVIHSDVLQRRILGLTSYYRSEQEQLMPAFVKKDGLDIEIVKSEMSAYQFDIYQRIRKDERDRDKEVKKNRKKKEAAGIVDLSISSSYRIFSRSACNFAFPAEFPRPMPDKKTKISEDDLNGLTKEMRKTKDDYIGDDEPTDVQVKSKIVDDDADEDEDAVDDDEMIKYQERLNRVLDNLKYDPKNPREKEFLTKDELPNYSPKFAKLLDNVSDPENKGLHLIYSQFRTLEGIGILKLILEANGFAEFKLRHDRGEWTFDIDEADYKKPRFVLYTGTETADEKELIRNIYNSSWNSISPVLAQKLSKIHDNNYMGEIIKVFMITSSGAEGISLQNTRFVHIVEPYWNSVRTDQVIGRARRICSHEKLEPSLRNVKVFMYMATLTKEQKTSEKNIELRIKDVSRVDGKSVITTDESLYEIAEVKRKINTQILMAIKQTAIDCTLYHGGPNSENIVCYGKGRRISTNEFNTFPNLEKDKDIRDVEVRWKAVKLTDAETGISYAVNKKTKEVFTMESYEEAANGTGELVLVGHLKEQKKDGKVGYKIVPI
jgi:hypothetical protein